MIPNGDGVKVLDLITKKVVETRDAFFNEEKLQINQLSINEATESTPPITSSPLLFPSTHMDTHEDNCTETPDKGTAAQ